MILQIAERLRVRRETFHKSKSKNLNCLFSFFNTAHTVTDSMADFPRMHSTITVRANFEELVLSSLSPSQQKVPHSNARRSEVAK